MGGRPYTLSPGRTIPLRLPAGRLVHIGLAVTSPTGAPVSDVWLTVNGHPSGFGTHPTGKAVTLTHDAGRLARGHEITTAWVPEALFGMHQLSLTVHYAVGDQALDIPLANVMVLQ